MAKGTANEAFQGVDRVVLVGPLPPPAGGMANQTRQLAELLSAASLSVSLVQTNAPYRPGWAARLPVVRAAFRLVPYLLTLWRETAGGSVVHVMANSGWAWHLFATPAIWVSRWRRVPVVVNYRGGEAAQFLENSHRVVRGSMRRVQGLVVPSAFLQEVFARFAMQATVVPNIINIERFRPRGVRVSGVAHLVVARNLEPLYDNATAIEAFRMVRARLPYARLTIAGSGPQALELAKLVSRLQLDDSIVFAGRLDRDAMAELYRSADLVLNPSLADNMPNSVLEALASGVPVVTTNVGGVPFIVKDHETAMLVPPGDPSAMARASLRVLEDDALWHRLSSAGVVEVQKYTWGHVAPLLAGAYRQAMQTAGSLGRYRT
jgi:glycosyltransferase involved in cell wall biosynthesis